jgi:hypothetical protein
MASTRLLAPVTLGFRVSRRGKCVLYPLSSLFYKLLPSSDQPFTANCEPSLCQGYSLVLCCALSSYFCGRRFDLTSVFLRDQSLYIVQLVIFTHPTSAGHFGNYSQAFNMKLHTLLYLVLTKCVQTHLGPVQGLRQTNLHTANIVQCVTPPSFAVNRA